MEYQNHPPSNIPVLSSLGYFHRRGAGSNQSQDYGYAKPNIKS